jgi:hypothetical protein
MNEKKGILQKHTSSNKFPLKDKDLQLPTGEGELNQVSLTFPLRNGHVIFQGPMGPSSPTKHVSSVHSSKWVQVPSENMPNSWRTMFSQGT